MPKLKESPEEVQNRLFKGLVAKNMAVCGYAYNKDLSPKLHMNERTLNYKMRDPDKFTRKELKLLFKILKFTEEEKSSVM